VRQRPSGAGARSARRREEGLVKQILKCRQCDAEYEVSSTWAPKICPDCRRQAIRSAKAVKASRKQRMVAGFATECRECGAPFRRPTKHEVRLCGPCRRKDSASKNRDYVKHEKEQERNERSKLLLKNDERPISTAEFLAMIQKYST
jgi:hypothetical protein